MSLLGCSHPPQFDHPHFTTSYLLFAFPFRLEALCPQDCPSSLFVSKQSYQQILSRPQRCPERWWGGNVWSGDFCSISSRDKDRDSERKWFSGLNMRNSHSSETLAWVYAGLGIIQLSDSSFSHCLPGSWEPDKYTPGKWTGHHGHTSNSFSAVLALKLDGLVCF